MTKAKLLLPALGCLVLCAMLGGCAVSNKAVLETGGSAVELRSYQSRAFDTTDKEKTLRTIIATLQDLGFVVDKADATLGSVSATKLSGYELRMTVTVRPRGQTQLIVRANAQYKEKAVEEPKPYQDFFTALEKSMFLAAQQVD
jgi:hypothetical protein